MPTQAKKVTATPTLDKQTKTKKKKKSNSSHKTNRKDSGSESNEGMRLLCLLKWFAYTYQPKSIIVLIGIVDDAKYV